VTDLVSKNFKWDLLSFSIMDFGLDVFLSDFGVLTKLGFPFSMVWLNGVQILVVVGCSVFG
jgi:hypothetical protein